MSNVNSNEVRAQLVSAVEATAVTFDEVAQKHANAKNAKAKNKLAIALAAAQKTHDDAKAALKAHDDAQAAAQKTHDDAKAAQPRPLAQAYSAEYTIPQVARPAAGAPPVDVNSVAKNAVSVPHNGAYDALKGRVGCRTHIMHVVLCEAYARGERLTASTITARVNVVWARALAGASTTEAATSSHLNTMKRRGYYANGALTKRAYLALTRGVAPETIPQSECE